MRQLQTEQRAALSALDSLLRSDLATIWRAADPTDARAMTQWLLEMVPELVNLHGDTAGLIAADFYDRARDLAGVPGQYRAVQIGPPPTAQIEASTRWAVEPLWTPGADRTTALTRLGGSAVRLARKPYHATIRQAVRRDPAKPRYARTLGVSDSGPCGFCTMLVSRGAVYWTEETDSGGFKAHDDCTCGTIPVFRDADLPEDSRRLSQEWQDVTRSTATSAEARLTWDRHIRASRT